MGTQRVMRVALRVLVVALAAIVVPTRVQGQASLDDPGKLGDWLMSYYQHPEPQRLVDAMRSASRLGILHRGETAPGVYGFLAGWFSENQDGTDSVVQQLLDLPPDDQAVVVAGLWYANTSSATSLLTKYLPRMSPDAQKLAGLIASNEHDAMKTPLEDGPGQLDVLWGFFSATGQEAPVVRIMQALPWSSSKDEPSRLAIGMAARWSLTSNAAEQPHVMQICRAQLASQPKAISKVLADVIKDAEKAMKKKSIESGRSRNDGS